MFSSFFDKVYLRVEAWSIVIEISMHIHTVDIISMLCRTGSPRPLGELGKEARVRQRIWILVRHQTHLRVVISRTSFWRWKQSNHDRKQGISDFENVIFNCFKKFSFKKISFESRFCMDWIARLLLNFLLKLLHQRVNRTLCKV